ncbi:hypothetical protein ONS95_002267 [Cadophora gregata]|uniref:uncharacterized protein n=1 Tax=Cadophora gregata TaxID=51156 RepID=UPI0026DC2AC5|nr:uncharacterized protein ONS95_002267 [Cadophora gregata]KAK0109582.1 hypothetical protein ONS95_002267 [Cadophora gregata]KAK0110785.1 hypothetical protein ONS96_002382 [Cadophora gregata f. sp. sojae]
MFYDLLTIPDPRPSKAHPDHRATRKAIEEELPYFDAKDLGLKAGVLALMLGIACYPRIKSEHDALEKIEKEKKKQKIELGKGRRERRRSEGYENRDRRTSDGYESSRRMSEAGERRRSAGWERDGYGNGYREREGRSRRR